MIIDMHTHLGRGLAELDQTQKDLYPELLIEVMDDAGIDKSVVFPVTYRDYREGIRELAGYRDRYPERLILFGRAGNTPDAADIVRWAHGEFGIRGMKFHHGIDKIPKDSPHLMEALAACLDLRLPVIFDTLDQNAFQVTEYPVRFPDLTIILAHMGGIWFFEAMEHAYQMAVKHPNVMLDTAACILWMEIERAVRRVGASKILFGTDAPVMHPAVERCRIERLRIAERDKELILGGNARKLLGV